MPLPTAPFYVSILIKDYRGARQRYTQPIVDSFARQELTGVCMYLQTCILDVKARKLKDHLRFFLRCLINTLTSAILPNLVYYTGAEHPNDVAADALNAAAIDKPEP